MSSVDERENGLYEESLTSGQIHCTAKRPEMQDQAPTQQEQRFWPNDPAVEWRERW
jgi:hypothetical protein